MGKYWDWYEVEFERAARKVEPVRREEILDSLREHAREATSEFATSHPEDEAERLAVKNLGSPMDLVCAELDTGRRQWLPVWVAGLGVGWCATWLMVGPIHLTMTMIWAGIAITPIAVFVATLASKRTKLWALGGTVASIGAATLAILCFTWLDLRAVGGIGVLPRWQVESTGGFLDGEIKGLSDAVAKMSETEAAFKGGNVAQAKTLTFKEGRGWMTPVGFRLGHRDRDVSWVQTFEAAQEAWASRTSSVKNDLRQKLEWATVNRAAMRDGRAFNPFGLFVSNLPSFVGVSLSVYLVLSLFHILGLLVVRLPASLSRRRWRVVL